MIDDSIPPWWDDCGYENVICDDSPNPAEIIHKWVVNNFRHQQNRKYIT